ncbi:hypothetical protein ES689_14190 [Frigoribacterium sp. ACAM 257]|uniref:hypothetical protein n=1 Tax=Frigoribacterium sp. ACAM 257 TaxID=2508998 RepID=UPI0011B9D3D4|nr:hypothetical protein [Frigoribacterium sp. ACAM 257]TWX34989.1 hypothetical protein ES689_14190 [Frigoribacterium sp. ACAM 257]
MIVTSLKRSYPNLLDDVRKGSNAMLPELRLESITRGNWKKMNAATLDGYLDFVVGTYDNMIVSAYRVDQVEQLEDGTIKFAGPSPFGERPQNDWLGLPSSNASHVPGEWLVGCPMPGGAWRQGESRGTRRYSTEAYLADHPELAGRVDEDFGGRMATNLLEHLATGRAIAIDDYPQLASAGTGSQLAAETGVTVVRQPGGTIIITIPTGTRAQLLIDPDGGASSSS